MAKSGFGIGLPAALLATALWGFTFLGPAAVDPVNVYYLVIGRYLIFGVISVAVLAARRQRVRRLSWRAILFALQLGVIGYIGFYLLLSLSAEIAGGVMASALTGLIPAMVALASNARERVLRWRRLIPFIVVITVGLVVMNGAAVNAGDPRVLVGFLLGFGAAVAWSYFVVANGIALHRISPAPDSAVWVSCIGLGAGLGSLALFPMAGAAGPPAPWLDASIWWPFIAWCLVLAVLGSWGATWFWNVATSRLPTTILGPIIAMEAVFGVIFNLGWQLRWPTWFEVFGIALVLVGVFACSYTFTRHRLLR